MKQIFSTPTKDIVKDPTRVLHSWFWNNLWYDIQAFFNPRQKWLTDIIPNHWCDKDAIIEKVLFACVVDYVENEKDGYKDASYDWSEELKKGYVSQEYVDNIIKRDKEILSVYKYIKEERPQLADKIEKFDDKYIESTDLLFKRDTQALKAIIEFRGYLWT
jgi:hypothetical protein